MSNFKRYDKNTTWIKKLVDKEVRKRETKQVNLPQVSRSVSNSSQSVSNSQESTTTSNSGFLTKVLMFAFGGPLGFSGLVEPVQRSAILPKGPLVAIDDETNDKIDLTYDTFSDPNYWMF